jgi:hypothetical protein
MRQDGEPVWGFGPGQDSSSGSVARVGTDGRAVQLTRAAAVAATTLAVATGAHVVAGGHPASPVLLAVLGLLLLGAAMPSSRRPTRPVPLLAWAAGGQLAVHLVLSWLHGDAHVAVAGHHGLEQAGAHASTAATGGTAMLVAHLLGTAVAVALILSTDRSAAAARRHWAWVRWVVTGSGRVPQTRAVLALDAGRRSRRGRPLHTAVLRRGPPLLSPA